MKINNNVLLQWFVIPAKTATITLPTTFTNAYYKSLPGCAEEISNYVGHNYLIHDKTISSFSITCTWYTDVAYSAGDCLNTTEFLSIGY